MSIDMKEIYEALRAPLPSWAFKEHPTKRGMTTINPMAVIARLNEVFGLDGWDAEYQDVEAVEYDTEHAKNGGKYTRHHRMIVKKCRLKIFSLNRIVEQYGGNDNEDCGDAHKGAATDALTKCASYLGIGSYVWTGGHDLAEPTRSDQDWALRQDRVDHLVNLLGHPAIDPMWREKMLVWLKKGPDVSDIEKGIKAVEAKIADAE